VWALRIPEQLDKATAASKKEGLSNHASTKFERYEYFIAADCKEY